ncbi:MAG: C40 family peptidase [Deltaproteobacteria bacterium]|nr:C40 family peptidase [Deltaproteobacteria bacterium]
MEEGDEEVEGETQSADGQSPEDGPDSSSSVEKGGVFTEVKDPELLARTAKIFLGAKYRRGGSTINGLDCSSYVQKVFWVLGIALPRTAREQFQLGMGVAREALRAGDLLFFKRSRARHPTHVGIYIGNDQFIHTSLSKRRVQIDTLDNRYFRLRFMGAKRIIEQKSSGTPANVG